MMMVPIKENKTSLINKKHIIIFYRKLIFWREHKFSRRTELCPIIKMSLVPNCLFSLALATWQHCSNQKFCLARICLEWGVFSAYLFLVKNFNLNFYLSEYIIIWSIQYLFSHHCLFLIVSK